jgi:hypothetical protein
LADRIERYAESVVKFARQCASAGYRAGELFDMIADFEHVQGDGTGGGEHAVELTNRLGSNGERVDERSGLLDGGVESVSLSESGSEDLRDGLGECLADRMGECVREAEGEGSGVVERLVKGSAAAAVQVQGAIAGDSGESLVRVREPKLRPR